MKRFKKAAIFCMIVAFIFGMSGLSAAAASTSVVSIDGEAMTFQTAYGKPYIDSANRTQVPIRAFSESLGSKIVWDQASQTATIDGEVKIKVGSTSIATANGTITMDTKAVNNNGRIYVPARYVANALGFDIESSNKNGTVTANVITKVNLTISAAASLKDALGEIQTLYKAEKPNAALAISFGGSGTLQQQIEQGAPADVFVSAATSNMNTLKDKNLLNNATIKNLLQNKLVLVVPVDSKTRIDSFKDVATSSDIKKIAMGEATTVPAGKYAHQTFKYYGVLDKVLAKTVTAKDVREVLTWVETGNVDAGVVYSTDAKISDKVKVITTAAEESHDKIIYPAAVIKATKHDAAAKDFLNFLSSDGAKAVFVKYGFTAL